MAKFDAKYIGGMPDLKKAFEGKLIADKAGIRMDAPSALGKAANVAGASLLIPGSRKLLSKAGVGGLSRGFSFEWEEIADWDVDGPDQFQKKVGAGRFMAFGVGAVIFQKKVGNHCFLTVANAADDTAVVELLNVLHREAEANIRAASASAGR